MLPDDTLLSITGGGRPEHYAIGLFNFGGPGRGFEAFASLLARCLTTLFDAKLHWGKHIPTGDTGWVARSYPQLDTFRALCKRFDPDGVFGNRFTDSLLGGP